MTSLLRRMLNVAIAGDEVGNAVLGGKPWETISGSVGRALMDGKPWAKVVAPVIDAVFGQGHCVYWAKVELARRASEPPLP